MLRGKLTRGCRPALLRPRADVDIVIGTVQPCGIAACRVEAADGVPVGRNHLHGLVDTQGADCRKQSGGDERSIERSLFNAQQLFRRLSVILVEARSAEFVVTIDGFSESVGIEAELLCQVFDGVGFGNPFA